MAEHCSFCGKRLDRYVESKTGGIVLECPARFGLIGHDPRHTIIRFRPAPPSQPPLP